MRTLSAAWRRFARPGFVAPGHGSVRAGGLPQASEDCVERKPTKKAALAGIKTSCGCQVPSSSLNHPPMRWQPGFLSSGCTAPGGSCSKSGACNVLLQLPLLWEIYNACLRRSSPLLGRRRVIGLLHIYI